MKGNFFNFLKEYKDKSFEEYPFCEGDIIVFCQLSYIDFFKFTNSDNYIESSVNIRTIASLPDTSALYPDIRYKKENSRLFEMVAGARRYENLTVKMPYSQTDTESEIQFCALTFCCEGILPFVTFRGTDKTLIGWKEDMNISFICPTPGQEMAAKYVLLADELLGSSFNIGGHSKGGNFAVYGAMAAPDEVRNRINRIYSLDGPGFRPETLERMNFDGIKDKMVKILPKSSLIGMLFEKENTFEVIEAKNVGISQHLLANWIIDKGNFIRTEHSAAADVMDRSINNWVYSTSEEDLEKFWNNLFEIISASDADNVVDFEKNLATSVYGMFQALKEVPKETQDEAYAIIKNYFEINRETLLPKIDVKMLQIKEEIMQGISNFEFSQIKEEFQKLELPRFPSSKSGNTDSNGDTK